MSRILEEPELDEFRTPCFVRIAGCAEQTVDIPPTEDFAPVYEAAQYGLR
jgi:hypothetical protein